MSRGLKCLLFLKHKCLVTLRLPKLSSLWEQRIHLQNAHLSVHLTSIGVAISIPLTFVVMAVQSKRWSICQSTGDKNTPNFHELLPWFDIPFLRIYLWMTTHLVCLKYWPFLDASLQVTKTPQISMNFCLDLISLFSEFTFEWPHLLKNMEKKHCYQWLIYCI